MVTQKQLEQSIQTIAEKWCLGKFKSAKFVDDNVGQATFTRYKTTAIYRFTIITKGERYYIRLNSKVYRIPEQRE